MFRKSNNILFIGFLLITGFVINMLYRGEIIVLRATDDLPLGVSPVRPASGANLIYTMNSGEEAQVLSCEDIKTDLVILLRLKSGETGYVAGGSYSLKRRKADLESLFFNFDQVTFSCKGMFENRSGEARGKKGSP